jgi:hypothetical protein
MSGVVPLELPTELSGLDDGIGLLSVESISILDFNDSLFE